MYTERGPDRPDAPRAGQKLSRAQRDRLARMRGILLVALGGAFGAVARHLVNQASARLLGVGFPWGTLLVNASGAFLLGLLLASEPRAAWAGPEVRLLFGTGVLGAFTTWSAFSVETVRLAEQVGWAPAAANVAAQLVAGLGAAVAGMALARALS